MKNVIYSVYTNISDNQLRQSDTFYGDNISKSEKTRIQFEKYKNRLIHSKTEYAKICNADFILFDEVDKKFVNDEFDSINFYKHHLMEKLLKEYDNVLYLDFDVIPNTTESFFEVHDMNKINVHAVDATKNNTWCESALIEWKKYEKGKPRNIGTEEKPDLMTPKRISELHFDKYHMYCKSLCKLSMLAIEMILSKDHHVVNTGIIGGSSESLSQIKMTERMDEMISIFNEAVEEELFDHFTKHHFINNEIFFSFILDRYKLNWNNLPFDWHYYVYPEEDNHTENWKNILKTKLKSAKLIQMISKDFDLIYDV